MALLRKLTGDERRTIAHWAMELIVVVAGVLEMKDPRVLESS